MDFTQMPVSQGYKYLLVMIDTFIEWIEGLLTWTEMAAAAAKSLQLYPTLRDPRGGSPPVSSIPGILQARILEWAAIFFSIFGGPSTLNVWCHVRS